jgi:hypothetical protein
MFVTLIPLVSTLACHRLLGDVTGLANREKPLLSLYHAGTVATE